MIAGVVFLRLAQHEAHLARVAADVTAAQAHVERVRAVSRRLYDALDETTTAADRLAKAQVQSVRQQLDGFRKAAESMATARRDTVEAANAYRDETAVDVGSEVKRVAHADDVLIASFVEAHRLIVTVLARPHTERQFSGAGKALQGAMRDAVAEFRSARDTIVAQMRNTLESSRLHAADAERAYGRVYAVAPLEAVLHP